MYFIRMGGVSVVGSSPEMLVRVEGLARRDASDRRHAAARPQRRRGHAAGRGAEAQREGARRARDARRSRPQRRRPRLRVRHRCACRSSWALERFSHVMHLTSIVEGKLADDRDRLDALVVVLSRPARCRARRRCARCRSSRSSSRRAAASTPARSAISISPATSISASRSAPSSCRDGKAYVQAGAGIVDRLEPGGRVRRNARQGAGAAAARSSSRRQGL